MSIFSKIGVLAIAGTMFAGSAFASTLTIMATDAGGDSVDFMVTYSGSGQCQANAECVESIFFDLTATDGESNARFAGGDDPVRKILDQGLRDGSFSFAVSDTTDPNDSDRSTRNALTFNFAAQDFDQGNGLNFRTWIRGLSGQGEGGGIDDSGAELYAAATLEDGRSASGFFESVRAGKATLVLDFGDVSEVPLPASALLLLGGLAGMGAMRRRQKA